MSEAIVFDIETVRRTGLRGWLRTDEKLARLEDLPDDLLERYADGVGVKLGNAKKPDLVRKKIEEHLNKEVDKGAVTSWGCEVCTIAARSMRGVMKDIADLRAGNPPPAKWPGQVWTVTEKMTERDVIQNFFAYLHQMDARKLIGFNIRGAGGWRVGFDVPKLRVRCFMLSIPWPDWLPKTLGADRRSDALWDICDVVDEGSCDRWLQCAEIPVKTGSGAAVQDMTPQERAAYCAGDVERERMLAGLIIDSTQAIALTEYLDE